MDEIKLSIPEDLFLELVKKFKSLKKENGERKYTDRDVSNIMFKLDSLIKEGKLKVSKK